MMSAERLQRLFDKGQSPDKIRQPAFVSTKAWAVSFYISLEQPLFIRCPQCWNEKSLRTRHEVARFLDRQCKCDACQLVMEKADYWPDNLSFKEAEQQFLKK